MAETADEPLGHDLSAISPDGSAEAKSSDGSSTEPTHMYMVGHYHHLGQLGYPLNIDLAIENWHRAAAMGHPGAQYQMSVVYLHGMGRVPQDLERSRRFCFNAARQGHPSAQYNLGVAYYHGLYGFRTNRDKARHWWTMAAQKGHSLSQLALSLTLKPRGRRWNCSCC